MVKTMKQSRLSLNDVEWGEFKIKDIFDVEGTKTTHPSILLPNGKNVRITCAGTNNGLDNFYNNPATEKGGVLTVDSATDGYVFYQNNDFLATDHVEKIVLKNKSKISKEVGLFLKTAIDNSKSSKYRYGYKFSQTRIKNQIISLPIDNKGNLNWQFMEEYIKQEQKDIAQKVISYYEQKMLETAFDLIGIEDVEWKEFNFNDVFRKIQRGRRLKKDDHIDGDVPYISSTSLNNGIDRFIGNEDKVRKFKNNITIANSGSVGSCFYHDYEYIASDHVTSLTLDKGDKYIYLFMSTIVKRLEEKYSFNREINDKRIRNERFILPIDEYGNPHWKYMSEFMKKLESENLQKVLEYIYIYIG